MAMGNQTRRAAQLRGQCNLCPQYLHGNQPATQTIYEYNPGTSFNTQVSTTNDTNISMATNRFRRIAQHTGQYNLDTSSDSQVSTTDDPNISMATNPASLNSRLQVSLGAEFVQDLLVV